MSDNRDYGDENPERPCDTEEPMDELRLNELQLGGACQALISINDALRRQAYAKEAFDGDQLIRHCLLARDERLAREAGCDQEQEAEPPQTSLRDDGITIALGVVITLCVALALAVGWLIVNHP